MISKKVGHFPSNKIYVSFTFDTEEDWVNSNPPFYYDSYKYITSGAFYQLIDGLHERTVSGTFYVTYNLGRDEPEVLTDLEERNQKIGIHLHPHNLKKVVYPYNPGNDSDKITFYCFDEKIKMMKMAKGKIESIVGHKILLYRSGQLACDYETERATKLVGFKAISNHIGVCYMGLPGIWNLGAGRCDLFDFNEFDDLDKYIELFKSEQEQIIVFSGHPMLLYNHDRDDICEKELNTFFEFLDYLRNEENVEIINQYQLFQMVENIGV